MKVPAGGGIIAFLVLLLTFAAGCSTAEPFRRGLAWGHELHETAATGECLRAYQYDEPELSECLEGVGVGLR